MTEIPWRLTAEEMQTITELVGKLAPLMEPMRAIVDRVNAGLAGLPAQDPPTDWIKIHSTRALLLYLQSNLSDVLRAYEDIKIDTAYALRQYKRDVEKQSIWLQQV